MAQQTMISLNMQLHPRSSFLLAPHMALQISWERQVGIIRLHSFWGLPLLRRKGKIFNTCIFVASVWLNLTSIVKIECPLEMYLEIFLEHWCVI